MDLKISTKESALFSSRQYGKGDLRQLYADEFPKALPTEQWQKWMEFTKTTPALGLDGKLKGLRGTIGDDSREFARDMAVARLLNGRDEATEATYFTMGGGSGSGNRALLDMLQTANPDKIKKPKLKELAERIQKAKPVDLDFEPIRRDIMRTLEESHGIKAYDKNGKLVDPRLRDLVHFECSFITTSALHNAAAMGINTVVPWTAASSGTIGQFKDVKSIAKHHGKSQKIVMVATTTDIKTAMERLSERYSENNEYQTTRGVLGGHKGFSQNFDEIVSEVDELYLFDTTKSLSEPNLIASKASPEAPLRIHDKTAFEEFKRKVTLDVEASNHEEVQKSLEAGKPR